MNKQDKELFWELCSFMKQDKQKLKSLMPTSATPEVLGHLFYNRMQAVAYGVLKENGLLSQVNREFRNSLAGAYQQNAEKNRSFYRGIKILQDALFRYEDKYVMLKGALLCGLYPNGYRTSNDIDLLVRPRDLTTIGEALKRVGFRQGSIRNGEFYPASRHEIIESKMMRGETVPYIYEVEMPHMRFLEVDVNFSLDYKNSNISVINSMLDRMTVNTVRGNRIVTLDRYDFFIHLCSHLYKEASTFPWVKMNRDMTLYKFCDLYMLLCNMDTNEIHELFKRADELGLADVCGCAIIWTSTLFDSCNPYAGEYARYFLGTNESLLHEVIAPAEHKRLIYTEHDIRKRFFAKDRASLLREV